MDKYAYLLSFSRWGTMAWLAHLDLMVVFERALRRAGLPLVWSKGYNPRPSLVFALPLGVGVECRRDLLEIETTEALDAAYILNNLNANLPKGLEIVDCKAGLEHKKSLMALVKAASYRVEGPGLGLAFGQLASRPDEVEVMREHKGKQSKLRLFSYIHSWEITSEDSFGYCCKAGSSENLRPDLVQKALAEARPDLADVSQGARIIREELYLTGLSPDLAGPLAELYNNS